MQVGNRGEETWEAKGGGRFCLQNMYEGPPWGGRSLKEGIGVRFSHATRSEELLIGKSEFVQPHPYDPMGEGHCHAKWPNCYLEWKFCQPSRNRVSLLQFNR